jgi:hypothetical protein
MDVSVRPDDLPQALREWDVCVYLKPLPANDEHRLGGKKPIVDRLTITF